MKAPVDEQTTAWAYHEAGHTAAILAIYGSLDPTTLPTTASAGEQPPAIRPWFAPARFFDWGCCPPEPHERLEAMRNRLCGPAIVAMAGPVTEARFTGRRLTEVLASAGGAADDAYLRIIGRRLYPDDFGWFRTEAISSAEAMLADEPWQAEVEALAALLLGEAIQAKAAQPTFQKLRAF